MKAVVTAMPDLRAAGYSSHALHATTCLWQEKNCYIDVWIEVLHALGLEPTAMLPFVLAVDFDDDQWTFFKPSLDEVREIYGIDVQEMTVWRPLVDHAVEHLRAGRLISSETDAYWLPDTAGTDYHRQHTKTTIVLVAIDPAAGRLGYFHNTGFHELEGADFAGVLRAVPPQGDGGALPLFAELLRCDRLTRRSDAELRALSRGLVARHFARRPATNPVRRFAERFVRDLPAVADAGLPHYHAWAFATTRQFGAAFELAAMHLEWLREPALAGAVDAFGGLAAGSKALILKAARAVNTRRIPDMTSLFDELATRWDRGMTCVGDWLAAPDQRALPRKAVSSAVS